MSNPLTDVLPDTLRKRLYALAFVAVIVFTAFQAADGDWKQFVGGLLGSLVTLLAASNTNGTILPKKNEAGAMSLDLVAVIAVIGLVAGVLALFGVRLDH